MRLTKIFTAVFITTLFVGNAFGQNRVPQFKEYPAGSIYSGKHTPLKLTVADRSFRTRLAYAAKQKVNFAGHYILTSWGCGAECLMGAAIDAKTGKVYWFDFTVCCWEHYGEENFEPINFRIDSNLIIFTGLRNEKEGDEKAHFYKFVNGKFVFIKDLPNKKS